MEASGIMPTIRRGSETAPERNRRDAMLPSTKLARKTRTRLTVLPTLLPLVLLAACTAGGATPAEVEAVKQRYGGYTVARAEQEGYVRDPFCLDAASFGLPAARGAMGFHATNEVLLRGPVRLPMDAGCPSGEATESTPRAIRAAWARTRRSSGGPSAAPRPGSGSLSTRMGQVATTGIFGAGQAARSWM